MSTRSACLLLAICLLLPVCARANKCTLTITNIAFGSYDVFVTANTTSTGSVQVSCNQSLPYTVSMSAGSGTLTSRVMKSGDSQLDYNLYTNSTHTTIWGDGTSGTVKVSATSLGATYTVYGLIPALQNVPVGSYSDTVTVTVTY